MLKQRIQAYLVQANTVEIQRLLDAKNKRQARMDDYKRQLADQKVYKSEKERFARELANAEAIHKKQAAELQTLIDQHSHSLEGKANSSPKQAMTVGGRSFLVPTPAIKTVEKYQDNPDVHKAMNDVADGKELPAPEGAVERADEENEQQQQQQPEETYEPDTGSGDKWTVGRAAKYALVASGIGYLFYKLRGITLSDVEDFTLLFMAMAGK